MKRIIHYLLILLFFPAWAQAQVKAAFTANITTGCAPLVVQFTSSSTGNPTSYQWNLGNGATVSTTNSKPSTTYSTPGTYTVSLTVSNGSGSNTETKTGYIIVRDTPKANFSASPLAGCPGTTINFSNSTVPNGSSATYAWYFGDGGSSNAQNPGYTYTSSGVYTVQLYATNNYGCKRLFERQNYVTIYDPPAIDFSADKPNICSAGTSVTFTGTANGTAPFTYAWNFNPGSGSGKTASNTFAGPAPKTYNIELTVTDGRGCVSKLMKPNFITLHNNIANFTSPNDVCVFMPITFTNTSTVPGATEMWYFGDGKTSTDISPTHVYSVAGTYTVKLVTNQGGCKSEKTKQIIVRPQPNADFTTAPQFPCPAPATIQFIPNATYSSYAWDVDGIPYTQSSPLHTFTQNKKYGISLIVTDNYGCKDTVVKSLDVNDLEDTVLAEPKKGCVPLQVTFVAIAMAPNLVPVPPAWYVPYPHPVVNYHWDFGDGNFVNTSTSNITHVYTLPGVYRVISTITTLNGCQAKDTVMIKAGTKPTASIIAPSRVCHREVIQFFSTSPLPANEHLWLFGDLSKDTAKDPKHQYMPGVYTLKYVSFFNGCPSDTVYKNIIVDSPDAQFVYKTFCHKDSLKYVQFTNKSIGATSWEWFFGDGQSSTALNPMHIYANYGTYTVMLTAYNSASGCRDTARQTFTLFNPHATIATNDSVGCIGDTMHFNSWLTGAVAQSYGWAGVKSMWLNGGANAGPNAAFEMLDTGINKITAIILDDHGCQHSDSVYVFISRPTPRFGAAPLTGCVPLTVLFKDSSKPFRNIVPIAGRTWRLGNGTKQVLTDTVSNIYAQAGSYDVTLIVTDTIGCVDSLSKKPFIHAYKPTASFTIKDKGCVGETVGVSNTSANGHSYIWDFGDGDTSHLIQPLHAYKYPGTYNITLIAIDGYGCTDTFTKSPGISLFKPIADFTLSDTLAVCPPLSVKFTNTSSGASKYRWVIDGKSQSAFGNINHLFTKSGFYPVKLIVTDTLGCKDSVTKNVNILGYAGGFSYTPIKGCVPLEVEFTGNLSNVPYTIWDFNDGNTANASAGIIKHTYTFPGSFTPKMIFTDGKGCTSINIGPDPILVDEAIAKFVTGPLCEYSDAHFIDTSSGYFSDITDRWWTFHDGKTSFHKKVTHYYSAAGAYQVSLAVKNKNGCVDTLDTIITVNPWPIIDAGADTIICLKDSATLYPSGGVSYIWIPSTYLSCDSCTNPKAGVPSRFVYTVQGTDANGCKNTDTVAVGIKTKVVAIITGGGEICRKDTIGLHASGAHEYLWIPAEGLNNNKIPDPIASPERTIPYIVISYEGSCIPDTDYVKVVVHELPTVEARGSQTIIAGNTADIQAHGSLISRFEWSPAASLSCSDCAAPTAKPTQTTTYTVKVYTDKGCVDSDDVIITVLCDKSQLFVPNTFTPNGDGQNDLFYPRGDGMDKIQSFRIYNRWGEIVFERRGFDLNDQFSGWDGTHKNVQLPPDVFVWVLEAQCDDGKILTLKGDVTIVR